MKTLYRILFLILTFFQTLFPSTFMPQQELTTPTTDALSQEWYQSVPDFRGTPYIEINHNIPFFTEEEKKIRQEDIRLAPYDAQNRSGQAFACLSENTLPEKERGDISRIKPSGWVQKKYKQKGKELFLYNRSHLLAYHLTGCDDPKNLITGTDYLNHDGMIPFERTIQEYIDDHPANHILYRVTPVYENEEPVARGVLLEAWSVEDGGFESFCVYCYNNQPGISIDYATGKSKRISK